MSTLQGNGVNAISNHLRDSLIPSLTTVRINNIFDHELLDLGGFPASTITLDSIDGEFADNTRNKRTFNFTIRIFIDRNAANFGSEKSEQILRSVADEFILKIDADTTVGGNCIFALASNARFGYIQRGTDNVRLVEITLKCVDVVQWR